MFMSLYQYILLLLLLQLLLLLLLLLRVANAINTRSNRLTARSLGAGGLHSSHGEAFFPGLIEEQSEAFRDGVPIGRDFDGG